MKTNLQFCLLTTVLLVASAGGTAHAGYCGGASYSVCPASCSAPAADYCQAQACCKTCYKTVREIVWEQQNYTCCKTVWDTCCEAVPITCCKTVYDTCYRDECYTICRPQYQTCYRDVCCKTCRPVYQTCYREQCYTVCKPVYETYYRDVCYQVCRPVYQTCYRECCYTVCRPVYQTCYRDCCYTVCKPVYTTCYRDCCYTTCRPVCETKTVCCCTGDWKTVKECIPGKVMCRCVQEPGTWVHDCSSLPDLQTGLLPDRTGPVPAHDLLPASVVPPRGTTSGVLHTLCAGMPHLPSSLHLLPHGIVLCDEASSLYGLSHGAAVLQADDSVHDVHNGS